MSENNGARGGLLGGVGEALKNSSVTQRLADEAKNYARARAGKLVDSVGDRITSVTDRLEGIADPSTVKGTVAGAKNLAEGKSPARAAVSATVTKAREKLTDKVKSLFGKGKGGGSPKMTSIVENVDIGLPVDQVYDQWTQYQEFSKFMKGVEGVEQTSEVESNWRVKVFKSRRTWKATTTEQIPDRRIAWTSEGAKGSTKGVVTFHPLADDLTRVLLVMEYYPSGFFEKTGNIWRSGGRRARLDMKHFRRFVMMNGEATGPGWRGEIRDGEVVEESEQAAEEREGPEAETEEREDERGARAGRTGRGSEEEPEGEYEEPEDEYEDEGEYEEEEEPEPVAAGSRRRRQPAPAQRGRGRGR